jgi:hypothetical protein
LETLVIMNVWQTFPTSVPEDKQIVWVRIRFYYGAPFLAQWVASEQSFWYDQNQLFIPWHLVQRWRVQ